MIFDILTILFLVSGFALIWRMVPDRWRGEQKVAEFGAPLQPIADASISAVDELWRIVREIEQENLQRSPHSRGREFSFGQGALSRQRASLCDIIGEFIGRRTGPALRRTERIIFSSRRLGMSLRRKYH